MRYLLFSLLLALAACSSPKTDAASNSTPNGEQWYTLYPKADGKPYFQTHSGKTYTSDLSIGRIEVGGDSLAKRMVLKDGITLRIFKGGVLYLKMSAEQAMSLSPFKELDFVKMTSFSRDSLEVEVERMHWTAGEPLVRTQGFVQMVTQDKILEGRGLEASLDFEYFALEKLTQVIDLESQVDQ